MLRRGEARTTMMDIFDDPLLRFLVAAALPITLADATSPDQELVFVNAPFERLTGYDRTEVLGHNCRVLQGPGTDPLVRAQIRDAIRNDRPFAGTLQNYTKSGTPFHNLLVIRPLEAPQRHLKLLMGCQFFFTGQFDVAELRAHLDLEQDIFKSLSTTL